MRKQTIIDEADCKPLGLLRGVTYYSAKVKGRDAELVKTGQVLHGPYDPELDPGHVVIASEPYIAGGIERRGYRVGRLLPPGTWDRLADEYEQQTGRRPPMREVVAVIRLE